MTADRHRESPYRFRPTKENREWLEAEKETGRPVNAILNLAVEILRKLTNPRKDDPS